MNKLQFIHCDTLFENSDAAKAYVNGDLVQINRPALYAEPMVLKYGEAENPNILLAIGSVGDGVTPSLKNKAFFIDFANLEESIAEIKSVVDSEQTDVDGLKETISNILSSCGFNENGLYQANSNDEILSEANTLNEADLLLSKAIKEHYDDLLDKINNIERLNVKDSKTISHKLTTEGKEITLISGVKLSKNMIVGDKLVENIIVKQDDGLFVNVRMSYDETENKLLFSVNDTTKDFKLPKENHVVGCEYDTKSESLIFTFKEPINENGGTTMSVDMSKLIGEWMVLGENTDTPIILTKEPVKSNELLHGADIYQDVLTADVRIASEDYKPYNILKKTDDNKFLYVDGTAKNIKYWKNGKMITVKDALDEIECSVSSHDGNIIYKKEDGIFANVDFDYNDSTNEIVFKKTDKDGNVESKTYQISNKSLLEEIRYDSETEEFVITYKDGNGNNKVVRFPVSSLFNEWETDNENHTVTLVKSLHDVSGTDKLSADVNISNAPNNILTTIGNGLYVNGIAKNIKYGENHTVKSILDLINGSNETEGSFRNAVKAEADARKNADDALTQKIGDNEKAIADNLDSINNEVQRAKSEEQRIETKFDAKLEEQKEANKNFVSELESIKGGLNDEITRSTSKDNELEAKINEHIAVSDMKFDGLKKDIDSVSSDLQTERNNRIDNDKFLTTSIKNEISRAEQAEKELDDKITSISGTVDTNLANIASLSAKINDETNRAKEAENALNERAALIENRVASNEVSISEAKQSISNIDSKVNLNTDSITKLQETIANVNEKVNANGSAIATEVERAKAEENAIRDEVNTIAGAVDGNNSSISELRETINTVNGKVTANEEAIAAETNRATERENSISDYVVAVDGKANKNSADISNLQTLVNSSNQEISDNKNAIAVETNRAIAAEQKLESDINAVNAHVSDVEEKIEENKTSIDAVSQALATEVSDRKSADEEIKRMISDATEGIKFDVESTSTLTLDKIVSSSGDVLKGNVVISNAEGNVLVNNNGVFAKVDLEYNSATNILTLSTSGIGSKSILLNNGSLVKNIYYDANSKELVIIYDSTDGSKDKETRVNVQDLFNEWIVLNESTSAIHLTKERIEPTQPDILKADVKLSNLESNLIKNTDGSLYASNSAYDIKFRDGSNVGERVFVLESNVKELDKDVKDAVSKVDEIKGKVDRIETDITSINSNVTDLSNRVSNTETNIATINNSITNINTRIDGVDSKVNDVNSKVTEVNDKVDKVSETVKDINDIITSGELNVNISGSSTDSVTTTVTKVDSTYEVKSNVRVSAAEGNSLKSTVDGLFVDASYDFGTY